MRLLCLAKAVTGDEAEGDLLLLNIIGNEAEENLRLWRKIRASAREWGEELGDVSLFDGFSVETYSPIDIRLVSSRENGFFDLVEELGDTDWTVVPEDLPVLSVPSDLERMRVFETKLYLTCYVEGTPFQRESASLQEEDLFALIEGKPRKEWIPWNPEWSEEIGVPVRSRKNGRLRSLVDRTYHNDLNGWCNLTDGGCDDMKNSELIEKLEENLQDDGKRND